MIEKTLTQPVPYTPRVVLVGGAHWDRVACSDSPFRPGSSNPGRLMERFGGAAFNAALAVRAFGAQAHLVSACGGDETAERIGAELDRVGIEDGRIAWLDRRSATYTALVDAGGELIGGVADMAIYERLVPRVLTRAHVRAQLAAADGILIDANLPASTLDHLVGWGCGRPIAAISVSPAKATRLTGALSGLDLLFASRAELAAILGMAIDAPDRDVVRAVAASSLRRAVVTDGPRPVLVIDGAEAACQSPPRIDTISDVVGAGDTLAGATFAALLADRSFPEAVRLGLAAAALRISVGLNADTADTAHDLACALPAPAPIIAD